MGKLTKNQKLADSSAMNKLHAKKIVNNSANS